MSYIPLHIPAAVSLSPATEEAISSIQALIHVMHKQPGSVLLLPVPHPVSSYLYGVSDVTP